MNWLKKSSLVLLTFAFSLNVLAREDVIAVFQFTANSMSAVGLENEVAYEVRNELSKRTNIVLISQREMEVELARNDIAQAFDSHEAIKAGQILNADFVIIGRVSKLQSKILTDLELVSTSRREVIESLALQFNNQQEFAARSGTIVDRFIDAIKTYHSQNASISAKSQNAWLAEFHARFASQTAVLEWQLSSSAPEAMGYNIYRSENKNGPFSYLTSVFDNRHIDNLSNLQGDIYYQVALLNEDGEEIRATEIVKVAIAQQTKSDISAPIVVSVSPLIKGIEFRLIPSASNADKNITGYHLLRRKLGEEWQIVDNYDLTQQTNSKKSTNLKEINLQDKHSNSLSSVSVQYAVRAYNAEEFGKLSDVQQYTPVAAPTINQHGKVLLRQAKLTWQPANAGEGYNVYRREQSDAPWRKIATLSNINNAEYIDTDFSADGQAFDYALTVFDNYAETELTAPVRLASKGQLTAPSNIQGLSGLARKAIVTWTPLNDPDVTGYAIYRNEYTEAEQVMLTEVARLAQADAAEYIDNSVLKDDQRYQYAVAAVNRFGSAGDLTEAITVTTKPLPQAPAELVAELSETGVNLHFSHSDLSSITQFYIERRFQSHQWHRLVQLDKTQTTFVDPALMANALVDYRISVVDEDGLQSHFIQSKSLQLPNSLSLALMQQNLLRKVALTWQVSEHIDRINVKRRAEGQDWQVIDTVENRSGDYVDQKDLIDDAKYDYQIETVYNGEIVSSSNLISAKTKAIKAPQGLRVKSDLPRRIELTWQTVQDNDIKSYLVFRWLSGESPLNASLLAEIPVSSEPTFIDTNDHENPIVDGVNYHYAIASRNVFDAIGPMNEPASGHSKPLPTKVDEVSIQVSDADITLNWRNGPEPDLNWTEISRKWAHSQEWQVLARIPANQLEYVDSQLLPYAQAEYRVQLIDSDELKSDFAYSTLITSPLTIDLRASSQGLLRKSELAWTSSDLVDEFAVLRSTDAQGWEKIVTGKFDSFNDQKGLLDERIYFYKVQVKHLQSILGESNIVEVKTKALPTPPQNIKLSQEQVKQVTLSWTVTEDTDVGGYRLYRLDNSGKLEELAKLDRERNEYIDDGSFFSKLEHGQSYQYVISSFNVHDVEGLRSEPLVGKTKSLPTSVSQVSANVANSGVVLKWQPHAQIDIQEYRVFRSKGCSNPRKYSDVQASEFQFVDAQVNPGNEYCYLVQAIDKDGLEGQMSETVKVSIPE